MTTLNQIPAYLDLRIKRGDDFSRLLTVTGVNLTSYTLEAGVLTVSGAIPITITASDLTTGKVYISLTDSQTDSIPSSGSTWYFSWTHSGITRTLLEGDVYIV